MDTWMPHGKGGHHKCSNPKKLFCREAVENGTMGPDGCHSMGAGAPHFLCGTNSVFILQNIS